MKLIAFCATSALLASPALAAASCAGSKEALSVKSWSIAAVDATTNALTVTIENKVGKPIRMIDASVGFVDALGEEIGRYTVTRDAQISPANPFVETKQWGPFTFERLLRLRPNEVETFVCVSSVLYDDGSRQEFSGTPAPLDNSLADELKDIIGN